MNGTHTITSFENNSTVCHAEPEWARNDDGDDIREAHTNTAESM